MTDDAKQPTESETTADPGRGRRGDSVTLVTGAAGAIGQPVCRELRARGHRVRAFDRVPVPADPSLPRGLEPSLVGELEDRAAVREAMQGVDRVVHLAAHPDDADFSVLAGPNVTGLFHVMDAARHAGVRRVVLASSVQVLGRGWGDPRQKPSSVVDAQPGNHYALTKVWAEQMGEMYARRYGLCTIAVRVAFMVRKPAEAERLVQKRLFDLYLSRGDVGRFFADAIEAPLKGFAVFYAVGRGGERLLDMEPAKRLLGFEARDRWPEGLGFEAPAQTPES